MAFTGQKIKGSRVLTNETIKNRGVFYKQMQDIKELNEERYIQLEHEMFWSMFEYLSHSAQKEFIDWARRIEWKELTKSNAI